MHKQRATTVPSCLYSKQLLSFQEISKAVLLYLPERLGHSVSLLSFKKFQSHINQSRFGYEFNFSILNNVIKFSCQGLYLPALLFLLTCCCNGFCPLMLQYNFLFCENAGNCSMRKLAQSQPMLEDWLDCLISSAGFDLPVV